MWIHVIQPARAIAGVHHVGEVHMSERDPDSFTDALKHDVVNPLTSQQVTSIHLVDISVHEAKDINQLNKIASGFMHMMFWVCWCE